MTLYQVIRHKTALQQAVQQGDADATDGERSDSTGDRMVFRNGCGADGGHVVVDEFKHSVVKGFSELSEVLNAGDAQRGRRQREQTSSRPTDLSGRRLPGGEPAHQAGQHGQGGPIGCNAYVKAKSVEQRGKDLNAVRRIADLLAEHEDKGHSKETKKTETEQPQLDVPLKLRQEPGPAGRHKSYSREQRRHGPAGRGQLDRRFLDATRCCHRLAPQSKSEDYISKGPRRSTSVAQVADVGESYSGPFRRFE